MDNEAATTVGLALTLTSCTQKFRAFISSNNVLLPYTCAPNKVNIHGDDDLSNS